MKRRVALRYFLSRGVLGPDLLKVEALVKRGEFDDALEALDELLIKKLGISVSRSSDGYTLRTEWFHTMDPRDQDQFVGIVDTLISVRNRIRNTPRDRLEVMPLEHLLDEVKHDLPWVEQKMRGQEDEFQHGPYRVILADGASDGLPEALEALDAASDKIRPKFPKVLYGKVMVRRGLRPTGTYDPSPHSGGSIAGGYVASGDFVNLSLYATPDRNSVMTLIHEFGHRYHTRFLHGDDRDKFKELFEVGDIRKEMFPLSDRKKIVEEYVTLWRMHQKDEFPDPDTVLSPRSQLWTANYPREDYKRDVIPWLKKFRDDHDESALPRLEAALGMYQYGGNLEVVLDKEQVSPVYASMYGMTSWEENFAEAFLAYVTGKVLPAPLQKFMAGLS